MRPLEVTWIPDDTIKPPGPKMVVCISPQHGWYFRINSKSVWTPSVQLLRVPDHPWLHHDSFLECNILELDDYVIDRALNQSGVIGAVSVELCPVIREAIRSNRHMSSTDKMVIHQVLQALTPR